MSGGGDDQEQGGDAAAELEAVRELVDYLHAGLEVLPYHEFLGVEADASGDALRAAFHERAQLLHPDGWYEHEDAGLRGRIYDVYKRVTEAYRVLADPAARRQYEAQRAKGANRLDTTERSGAGPKRPEEAVANPQARKYYLLALDAERRGDKKSAAFNLKLALQLEPGNPVLKEKLEKAEKS